MPNPGTGGVFDPTRDYLLTGNIQLAGAGSAIQQYGINASPGTTYVLPVSQSGQTFLFDRAAGVTYTLPNLSSSTQGLNYTFVVTTSVTSNNHKIITYTGSGGTNLLIGSTWSTVAAGTGTQFFANNSTHVAVTMNGTTTGGLINTVLYFVQVSATQWLVDGTVEGSGTIATSFATS